VFAGNSSFEAGIDPVDVLFGGHEAWLKEPHFKYSTNKYKINYSTLTLRFYQACKYLIHHDIINHNFSCLIIY
jgi:hypothetical protein